MKTLNYEFKRILNRHPVSQSKSTHAKSHERAQSAATMLHKKFNQLKTSSISEKHAFYLVGEMKKLGWSAGHMKNTMAFIRHILRFGGRTGAWAKSNSHYGIPTRQYVTNKDKSEKLTNEKLERIKDPFVQMSIRLQDAFGLRAEESMKIQPARVHIKDKTGEYLQMDASWCKGGRERNIPITKDEQRKLLEEAKAMAATTPKKSLIPAYPADPDGKRRDYKHHVKTYKSETKKAGCSHTHGFRHGAIQKAYEVKTNRLASDRHGEPGWKCGVAGGKYSNELNPWQREIDREVRRELMGHIGHGPDRFDTIAIYLGS